MKVAVIGANGQLGSDVVAAPSQKTGTKSVALTHADIEIAEHSTRFRRACADCSRRLSSIRRRCITWRTANRNRRRRSAVNALGPRNLALVARELGAVLMHVSTDYVFDGRKGNSVRETDAATALECLRQSRNWPVSILFATTDKHFVVRTSGLYGKSPCRAKGGLNFVELMLKLARERGEVRVVDSEVVTPTSTEDLAGRLLR